MTDDRLCVCGAPLTGTRGPAAVRCKPCQLQLANLRQAVKRYTSPDARRPAIQLDTLAETIVGVGGPRLFEALLEQAIEQGMVPEGKDRHGVARAVIAARALRSALQA